MSPGRIGTQVGEPSEPTDETGVDTCVLCGPHYSATWRAPSREPCMMAVDSLPINVCQNADLINFISSNANGAHCARWSASHRKVPLPLVP